MDLWPCDGSKPVSGSLARQKQKAIETFSYPLVTYNTPNYMALVKKDERFEWTSIFKGEKRNKLRAGEIHVAFPPTCPLPLASSKISVKKHAEQRANFIRTYYPNIDVPTELLVEQVVEESSRKPSKFDPFMGTLLDSIATSDPSGRQQAFLVFPMGELRRDLNLSPLYYSEGGHLVFKPFAEPACTSHKTPILQVVASRSSDSQKRYSPYGQEPYFAVRTYGQTVLCKAEARHNSGPRLDELATVSSSDVDGHAIWDVRLSSQLAAYFVNSRGAVYYGDFSRGCKALNAVCRGADGTEERDHRNFCRIALGSKPLHCILTSGSEAFLLDCRANASLKLFSLDILQDVFTSVEDECSDGIVRFCTTDQVLWIDKRYATKPLLGFKHDRDRDYTLQTRTFFCERELTILTSRKNSVMTLYDVSRPSGYPLSIHNSPYCIHPSSNCGTDNFGQLLFRPPHSLNQPSFTLFQIHERGDITYFDVSVPSQRGSDMVLEWSNQIEALKTEGDNRQEDAGPLGMRERKEVDFSMVYEYLFHNCEEKREKSAKAEAEIIYDIIDQALMFWKKAETPEEQILTSFDILFRAGEMSQRTSNSDFLSDAIINSDSLFQALTQGRLSAEMLGKGSVWHHDISPALRHYIPEATQNVQMLTDSLSQLDLNVGENRAQGSVRREIRAREQLALDMVLASNIYSSHPFANSAQKHQDLESLTEALSLNSDVPPIQFGYLRPSKQDVDVEDKDLGDALTCSLGIRLLLKEWTVGTDPKDYCHRTFQGPGAKTKTFGVEETANQKAAQPPAIVKAGMIALPPIPRRERSPVTQSQPIGETTDGLAVSQEIMASTQILPGPYGGRSVLSKKKPAKKRMGGF